VDAPEVDLLGDPFHKADLPSAPRKRREPRPAGYGGIPGTGPAGEKCRTCIHHVRVRLAKDYHKCELARAKWTGGAKSDIRLRTPACSRWAAKQGAQNDELLRRLEAVKP
jgi:hypothetical protein